MPRGKCPNWKRGEVEAFPHPAWRALVRRGENLVQPRDPKRRSTQELLTLLSLEGFGEPIPEHVLGYRSGHAYCEAWTEEAQMRLS